MHERCLIVPIDYDRLHRDPAMCKRV